jgi:hypothetical protein
MDDLVATRLISISELATEMQSLEVKAGLATWRSLKSELELQMKLGRNSSLRPSELSHIHLQTKEERLRRLLRKETRAAGQNAVPPLPQAPIGRSRRGP